MSCSTYSRSPLINFLPAFSERTRLVHDSGRRQRSISSSVDPDGPRFVQNGSTPVGSHCGLNLVVLAIVILFILSTITYITVSLDQAYNADPADPRVRDRIRREWALEEQNHELQVKKYRTEELSWKEKIREYEGRLARERREGEEIRDRIRREWVLEQQNHQLKVKEYRAEELFLQEKIREYEERLARERREGDQMRDRIRGEWAFEQQNHVLKVKEYREEELSWQGKIREYEERLARERREREQMQLYWADVEPVGQCLGKNKRKYGARLGNLLSSIDGVAACKATPFVMNGKTYESPQYCETGVRIPAFCVHS